MCYDSKSLPYITVYCSRKKETDLITPKKMQLLWAYNSSNTFIVQRNEYFDIIMNEKKRLSADLLYDPQYINVTMIR